MTKAQRIRELWWRARYYKARFWPMTTGRKLKILGGSEEVVRARLVPFYWKRKNKTVWVHPAIWKRLNDAVWDIDQYEKKHGKDFKIKTLEAFCWRLIRGSKTSRSNHSWAIAVDINAADYPLGSDRRLPGYIVIAFHRRGFRYGGDWKRRDPMHLEG